MLLEYIKVLTSWQVVGLIFALIFSKELKLMIDRLSTRITKAEFGENRIEFSRPIEEEYQIAKVIDQIEEKHPAEFQEALRGADVSRDVVDVYRADIRSQVRFVQQFLKDKGYDIAHVDGIVGPKTRAATLKFQEDYGLRRDGIIGLQTLSKIRQLRGEVPTRTTDSLK